MDLDGLCIKFQTLLFVNKKFLNVFPLIALKLNHLTHLRVIDDGAIAGEFLLDDLQYLLLVELLGKPLYGSQGFTTIALLNSNMNVILRLLCFPSVFVGLGEGVEGLEVFD